MAPPSATRRPCACGHDALVLPKAPEELASRGRGNGRLPLAPFFPIQPPSPPRHACQARPPRRQCDHAEAAAVALALAAAPGTRHAAAGRRRPR